MSKPDSERRAGPPDEAIIPPPPWWAGAAYRRQVEVRSDGNSKQLSRRLSHPTARLLGIALLVVCSLTAADTARGQERLIDRDPFDRVVLDQANGSHELDILPGALPDGPLAELPRSGTLRVRLAERPLEEFQIRWANIVEVKRYEELVTEEAQRLARAGRFREAHEYLAFLQRHYGGMAGLSQAIDVVLELEIAQAYQQGEYERSWMILTALFDRSPDRPGVAQALVSVTDRLLSADVNAGDFAKARRFLELLRTRFGKAGGQVAERWSTRLRGIADEKLAAAETHFAAERLDEARQAVRAALAVEPDRAEAVALLSRIVAARPRVVVGVVAEAPRRVTRRLDDWASRRVASLIDPPLVELRGYSEDGGEYQSAFGDILHDATGLATSVTFSPAAPGRVTPHAVARRILALGQSNNRGLAETLVGHLAGVGIEGTQTLRLEWRHAHVRPEALLRIGLSDDVSLVSTAAGPTNHAAGSYGPFQWKARTADEVTFSRREESLPAGASGAPPREVVERLFASEGEAVDALLRGEIDIVERVAPADVGRLAGRNDLVVDSYALPTVHVLVTSATSPLMASSEVRRAIAYAIDRPGLARQLFAADPPTGGAQVISGPFPPGSDYADPVGYAYDRSIEPRPFDPHLAATLASVAARLDEAPGKSGADPEIGESGLPELALAHPREPLARAACQLIAGQLEAVGIAVRLVECDPAELADGTCAFDLRYAELAMWEPVVDAPRLLGPRGEAGGSSARMALALAGLDEARTWQGVRQTLHEVHRVAYDELRVIPLWQTTNRFAYRGGLSGVGSQPVTLYQNVAGWELARTRGSVAAK